MLVRLKVRNEKLFCANYGSRASCYLFWITQLLTEAFEEIFLSYSKLYVNKFCKILVLFVFLFYSVEVSYVLIHILQAAVKLFVNGVSGIIVFVSHAVSRAITFMFLLTLLSTGNQYNIMNLLKLLLFIFIMFTCPD